MLRRMCVNAKKKMLDVVLENRVWCKGRMHYNANMQSMKATQSIINREVGIRKHRNIS